MYGSEGGNSCVEKTSRLAAVSHHILPVDGNLSLCGEKLQMAIAKDIKDEKFPFACVATLGTTGTCAFDNLPEVGPICRAIKMWLHIDAAYAGSALCCPEFRPLMQGIEYGDSFNFNRHEWMMANFDCSAMWFRNAIKVVDVFNIDRIFLRHSFEIDSKAPEYRNWGLHWVIVSVRSKYGLHYELLALNTFVENFRNHVHLADQFAEMISNYVCFEIIGKPVLGLVCFRPNSNCEYTKRLVDSLTERKNINVIRGSEHNIMTNW